MNNKFLQLYFRKKTCLDVVVCVKINCIICNGKCFQLVMQIKLLRSNFFKLERYDAIYSNIVGCTQRSRGIMLFIDYVLHSTNKPGSWKKCLDLFTKSNKVLKWTNYIFWFLKIKLYTTYSSILDTFLNRKLWQNRTKLVEMAHNTNHGKLIRFYTVRENVRNIVKSNKLSEESVPLIIQ